MKKFNRIVLGKNMGVLDPFCIRQFKEGSTGYIKYDTKEF